VLQDGKATILSAHIVMCMYDDNAIVMNMTRWQEKGDVV
jgi:hypothetical protein